MYVTARSCARIACVVGIACRTLEIVDRLEAPRLSPWAPRVAYFRNDVDVAWIFHVRVRVLRAFVAP